MDDVDRTAERTEKETPLLIKNSKKPEGPKPTGFCAFCDAPLPEGELRFCDAYCRDDYDFAIKRAKINGTTKEQP